MPRKRKKIKETEEFITRAEYRRRTGHGRWKIERLIRTGVVRAYTEGIAGRTAKQFLKWPESRDAVMCPIPVRKRGAK